MPSLLYPNHRYLGPGNPIDNGTPVDNADRIAQVHDIEYNSARTKEEKERQTMKRTVQVMAPSDDESVNSDQSDAEEFATPTTKEPLKKRMLFKKK